MKGSRNELVHAVSHPARQSDRQLKAEHNQRIASRELADEFTGLIEELEIDKQFAMIDGCHTSLSYINSHQAAFN